MFDSRIFLLNQENFSSVTNAIHENLTKTKATEKEIYYADLLMEEIVTRTVDLSKIEEFTITVQESFGNVNLKIVGEGAEFNPLVEITDFDEDDADYYRTLILKANRSKMDYSRQNNKNIISIKVHDSANRQVYLTLAGLVFGSLFGCILKFAASSEMIAFFSDKISGIFTTLFMNALTMMLAPLVFFSVLSGILGMANVANSGRIGGKLIGFYSLTTVISSGIGLFLAIIFFAGGVNQISNVGNVEVNAAPEISILSTILNIIPKNLVAPFMNRELIQVIFVAVIFGICINKLGDKVKNLKIFVGEANEFCIKLITMIAEFVPLVVFLSMADLVLSTGAESILLLGKLILGVFTGCCVMVFVVYSALLRIVGKISPIPLLKKISEVLTISLGTSSSNITMPFTMKTCTNKLGISPKLSSFSIPIGATVNMDGCGIYYAMVGIMFLKMYGVEIDYNVICTLFLTVFTISVGTPGVPNVLVVCTGAIISAFGIPVSAAAILFGICPIIDRIITCNNVVGDVAVTTALASNENLIDKKIYLT